MSPDRATLPNARAAWRLIVLLAAWPACAGAAFAGTTIERGDVLHVEVLRAPDFTREARVDVDGRVSLPLLGPVEVAGEDLEGVRRILETALAERGLVMDPVVVVEVAAYRPVYVGGAVGAPGTVDYTPGLTVRQALIAAGGPRLGPDARQLAPEEIIAAAAESRSVSFQLAQVRARIARLREEIVGSPSDSASAAATESTASEAERAEAELLADRRTRATGLSAHTEDLVALIELELETLSQQAELQDREAQVQQEEIDTTRELISRGLVPRSRLAELLREQSQLSRDLLENNAFAARARQAKSEVRFEEADLVAEEREEMRLELQEAERERAELEAQLQALQASIAAGGVALSGSGLPPPPEPRVVIHRQSGGETSSISSDVDAPVEPGDVLEVTLDTSPPLAPVAALPQDWDPQDPNR